MHTGEGGGVGAQPGDLLGGYRLLKIIGEGGMGRVWLAGREGDGARFALKVLLPELSGDERAVRRFLAEAAAMRAIQHEGVAHIFDISDASESRRYYVMQLLQGEDLQRAMRRTILALPRSLDIGAQLASVLAAVHEAGIVHRDIKPENIYLANENGRRDVVKLLDFGVAKLQGEPQDGFDVTRTAAGALVGTPQYMSPEQLNGQPVDERSDVYSFGLVLYELVSGRRPVKGTSLGDVAVEHLTVTPTRPSQLESLPHPIPIPLDELVLSCLEKDPTHRPKSFAAIARALRSMAEESVMQPRDEATTGFSTGFTVSEPEDQPLPPETSGEHPLAPSSFPRRFGQYTLLASLGRGGMGDVCLAKRSGPAGIQQLCVLKQIRFDKIDNDDYVRRFVDEARVMAELNHANISHVLEVGSANDTFYMAMEHIHGITLSDLTHKLTALPRPIALLIMTEVLAGLDYAHRHKDPLTGERSPVVHRDVSPHNVMVNYEGEVKLIDFGLATTIKRTEHTESDVVMGKVAYMSPEQARGEQVDPRTDQYAAAVSLTEVLIGDRFYGDRPMHAVWGLCSQGTHRPDGFADIPDELRAVLDRALANDPKERFDDCRMFAAALRDAGFDDAVGDGRTVLRNFLQENFAADQEKSWRRIQDALARAPGTSPPETARSDTPFTSRNYTGSIIRERRNVTRFVAAGGGLLLLLGVVWLALSPEPEADKPAETAATLAPPRTVELSFKSTPEGANVSVGEDKRPVGITPHIVTADHSATAEVYWVELEGHQPARFVVTADRDREIFAQLLKVGEVLPDDTPAVTTDDAPPAVKKTPRKRVRRPARKRTRRGRKPVDKNAVADPW
jgi:serine/threonine protein kinase